MATPFGAESAMPSNKIAGSFLAGTWTTILSAAACRKSTRDLFRYIELMGDFLMTRSHFVLLLLALIACESRAYAGCPGGVCVVPAGGDLQAALNTAVGGDVIKLQAGATFTGHYVLPVHSGESFVTVTTTATVADPVDVIQLCYQQGPNFAAEMLKKAACKAALIGRYATAPKIVTPNTGSAVSTAPGADYWKFVGIELATSWQDRGNSCAATYSIVALGLNNGMDVRRLDDLPDHVVFDRTYIHGNPVGCSRRAILAQATNFEFINSVCTDIHESGNDSQCVMAYNSPGPFVIRNNFGEAAGENVMFGGADPTISGLIQ
jgi:hypothetical protein